MNAFSKNQVNFYTVDLHDEDQRLDNLLIKLLKGVPKSYIYRIIRSGEVRLNSKRTNQSTKVQLNDVIRIPPVSINIQPAQVEPHIPEATFPILFEDEYLLIIDKPSGIACHGGSGVSFGVIEQLRKSLDKNKFLELAHRLDRSTSGVLILAKKRQALVAIQNMMRNNQIQKYYLALTLREMPESSYNIKLPLLKYLTKDNEYRVKVDHVDGQFCHTIFSVIKHYHNFTLVKANLKTGRTHQIRVHLQSLGHPIAGDDKYGDFSYNKELARLGLKRMFLHAQELRFKHPITGGAITVHAELPRELKKFLNSLVPNLK